MIVVKYDGRLTGMQAAGKGSRMVVSVGPTWFRRGLQSRTGHTEAWLPRKYTQKSITANDNSYALAA